MSHVVSKPPPEPGSTSAEPETAKPMREALRLCEAVVLWNDFPHLASPPEATIEQVLAAALDVERAVQVRLLAAGGTGAKLKSRHARTLWNAQYQAHTAVFRTTGYRKDAKAIQAEAAGEGQALTVCAGYQFRRLAEHVMRFNAPDMFTQEHPDHVPLVPLGEGDGCGMIMLDSSEPRTPKRYCPRCSARAGRTLNAGLAKSALARVRASRRAA